MSALQAAERVVIRHTCPMCVKLGWEAGDIRLVYLRSQRCLVILSGICLKKAHVLTYNECAQIIASSNEEQISYPVSLVEAK